MSCWVRSALIAASDGGGNIGVRKPAAARCPAAPARKDLELIRKIANQGGGTGGNIDRQKYQRLVNLGWLQATPTNVSDVLYHVMAEGKEIAAAEAQGSLASHE